jgi:hypothetical protein
MAKTWILDTDTKGTGAEMVPLEKVLERRGSVTQKDATPSLRVYRRRPKSRVKEEVPKPRLPRRFKVVDVMTGQVLSEDADVRDTLAVLGRTRSTVDLRVYVWDPKADGWRALTLGEQKLLWGRAVTDSE